MEGIFVYCAVFLSPLKAVPLKAAPGRWILILFECFLSATPGGVYKLIYPLREWRGPGF